MEVYKVKKKLQELKDVDYEILNEVFEELSWGNVQTATDLILKNIGINMYEIFKVIAKDSGKFNLFNPGRFNMFTMIKLIKAKQYQDAAELICTTAR